MDKPIRILIVDDKPQEVFELIPQLEKEGYQVKLIEDGATALVSIIQDIPNLIILDIGLGGLSGLQVCRTINASPATADIPVIFLTFETDVDTKIQGFKVGCVDYITKPFDILETMARVRVHLGLSQKVFKRKSVSYSNVVMTALTFLIGEEGHKLNVADVAKKCGVSESTLRRHFSKEFDMSLMSYVRETRFDWAKHMLGTSNNALFVMFRPFLT